MRVRVLFFAGLRDVFGQEELFMQLSQGATLVELLEKIFHGRADQDRYCKALAFAVNHEFVSTATTLREGDEVALLPPVAGG